jgi:hypothetical protein
VATTAGETHHVFVPDTPDEPAERETAPDRSPSAVGRGARRPRRVRRPAIARPRPRRRPVVGLPALPPSRRGTGDARRRSALPLDGRVTSGGRTGPVVPDRRRVVGSVPVVGVERRSSERRLVRRPNESAAGVPPRPRPVASGPNTLGARSCRHGTTWST